MPNLRFYLLTVLVVTLSVNLFGQERRRTLTFHPRTYEMTKYFLLTEFGYDYRLTQTGSHDNPYDRKNFHFSYDFGAMKNLSSKWAAGVTLYLGLDDSGSRLAIKPRVRRWLGENQSLDFSAGPTIKNMSTFYGEAPGLAAHLAYSYGDWGALTFSAEVIPYKAAIEINEFNQVVWDEGTETTFFAGIRAGSYPGLVSAVLLPIVVFIHFVIVYEP